MLKIKVRNTGSSCLAAMVFYVLLFQSALERIHPAFAYADELFALSGFLLLCASCLYSGTLRLKRSTVRMLFAFCVFLAAGVLGNLLYRCQPLTVVLTDLYTNVKFFLAVISGKLLFRCCASARETMLRHARAAACLLFSLLVLDLLFAVFPSMGMRYGLRAVQLCFRHPTYLAGAAVFLLSILTAFYEKSGRIHLVLCLFALVFTLRSKAIAAAAVYCLIFWFAIWRQKPLKLRHLVLLALAAFLAAGEQLAYYYIELEGRSARSVLTQTSLAIVRDYFPIGTGFGTFASSEAAKHYSPVYLQYGFQYLPELDGIGRDFLSDTFWPILLGQTGFLGTVSYAAVLGMLLARVLKVRAVSVSAYASGSFIFAYLLISSTSEPAFHNSIAVPLAMVLGAILTLETQKEETS